MTFNSLHLGVYMIIKGYFITIEISSVEQPGEGQGQGHSLPTPPLWRRP